MTHPATASFPPLSIQIFADGADQASMVAMAADPSISGFTTNPSLMHKAGVRDYRAFAKALIQAIPTKPISFEIFADEPEAMRRQALEIGAFGENVYVKIPVTNSKGISTAPLVSELSQKGIKLNVTAIFTLPQVWEVCQALKSGAPSIVSVFAGRIGDSGIDPIPVMEAARAMCIATDPNIKLLWASTRELFNIVQADKMGCDIITVPTDLLKKRSGFGKDLNAASLETVQAFKKDAEAAGFSL